MPTTSLQIDTTRFGPVEIRPDDILAFPAGLPGLEDCRRWVLLGDGASDTLAWLQSVDRADVALAVVSPRRYVPGYFMRVARREVESLLFDDIRTARVLVVVSQCDGQLTINLKAPLVLNLARRLGRQVVANGDLSVRHVLFEAAPLKKSA